MVMMIIIHSCVCNFGFNDLSGLFLYSEFYEWFARLSGVSLLNKAR